MRKSVYVWFKVDPAVRVGNEPFSISEVSSSLIKVEIDDPDGLDMIQYNGEGTTIDLCYSDGHVVLVDKSEYDNYVQPFVDLWQVKKDEQEQQQEQEQEDWNKFENRQSRALTQLNEDFETAKERAYIVSSLGFTVDANQTANENVTGLLVTISDAETVQFCDYHNIFRELTKANLQTLQTEIIANAQNLYQQKWVYRTQIEQCGDNEQLDAVLEGINFTYMDFTPTGDGETETGEQV